MNDLRNTTGELQVQPPALPNPDGEVRDVSLDTHLKAADAAASVPGAGIECRAEPDPPVHDDPTSPADVDRALAGIAPMMSREDRLVNFEPTLKSPADAVHKPVDQAPQAIAMSRDVGARVLPRLQTAYSFPGGFRSTETNTLAGTDAGQPESAPAPDKRGGQQETSAVNADTTNNTDKPKHSTPAEDEISSEGANKAPEVAEESEERTATEAGGEGGGDHVDETLVGGEDDEPIQERSGRFMRDRVMMERAENILPDALREGYREISPINGSGTTTRAEWYASKEHDIALSSVEESVETRMAHLDYAAEAYQSAVRGGTYFTNQEISGERKTSRNPLLLSESMRNAMFAQDYLSVSVARIENRTLTDEEYQIVYRNICNTLDIMTRHPEIGQYREDLMTGGPLNPHRGLLAGIAETVLLAATARPVRQLSTGKAQETFMVTPLTALRRNEGPDGSVILINGGEYPVDAKLANSKAVEDVVIGTHAHAVWDALGRPHESDYIADWIDQRGSKQRGGSKRRRASWRKPPAREMYFALLEVAEMLVYEGSRGITLTDDEQTAIELMQRGICQDISEAARTTHGIPNLADLAQFK